MGKQIAGVPSSITRADYCQLIDDVGLDPALVTELRFAKDGVYATVFAVDADGKKIVAGNDVAKHQVFIEVIDQ